MIFGDFIAIFRFGMKPGGQQLPADPSNIWSERSRGVVFFDFFHFLLAHLLGSGLFLAVYKSQILIMLGTKVDIAKTNQYVFLGGPRMAQNRVFWHVSGRKSLFRDG